MSASKHPAKQGASDESLFQEFLTAANLNAGARD
jgi:hypothetical protein